MEEREQFGARIRQLREKAQLTQRELAEQVEINFTYLSKIENGVLPPPAEKVILRLAEVLNTDKDELIALAGKIPSDIAIMLKSHDMSEFGKKLRQLRIQAGMSQKELAEKLNIEPSYLSKIETGAKSPPREKVISDLAEVLNVDKDEFLSLAGKVSPDMAKMLQKRKALQSLRSGGLKKWRRGFSEDREGVHIMKRLKSLRDPSIPIKSFLSRPIPFKSLSRIAIAVVLVIAVATSLWYSAPARALEISFPSLPSTGITGGSYSFTLKVTIAESELLPIQSINLSIYNSADPGSYTASATNLPLTSGSKSYTTTQTGGGAITVTATAASTWGTGYGYGYAAWQGYGYHFFSPSGYGYGYGYGGGATSITYAVTWTPPLNWPAGGYKAKATITANGTTFTQTSSQVTMSVGGGIAGQVTLQSRGSAPGNDWIIPATIKLWTVGANRATANPIATYNVTTSNTGSFEVTGISPDSYDITVKGSHTLRKVIGNNSISGGVLTTVNFGTLIEGDSWGPSNAPDNVVDISDYSAILYSFGATSSSSNWIETCDLNEDTVVDTSDYSIVLYNFGQSGD